MVGRNSCRPDIELQVEDPQILLKPPTILVGKGDPVVQLWMSQWVIYDSELAGAMGKKAADGPVDGAQEHVLGWTRADHVTVKNLNDEDRSATGRAKILDTSGRWVV